MFHTHSWQEVLRSFSKPPQNLNMHGGTERLYRECMFGITTIELKCRICGDLKHVEAAGDLSKDTEGASSCLPRSPK